MPADVIANALLGKGIGNILFPRTVGFPHCCYALQIAITEYPRSPSGWIRA